MKGKISSVIAVVALAVSGLSLGVANVANAAGLPSLRLVSPVFDSSNSVDATSDISQYYSAATKAYYAYIGAGSTLHLTFHATKDGTTAWANQEIDLLVDAPYSGSKAHWTAGGTAVNPPAQVDASFGYKYVGTTDANGNVTFDLVNTDTTSLEPAPANATTPRPTTRLYGTLKPTIAGITDDKALDSDLPTFDITDAKAQVYPAAKFAPTPTIRIVTPTLTDTNSIHRADLEKMFSIDNNWYAKGVGFRQVYMPVGTKFTLAYKVTDQSGAAMANTVVKLHVNKAYSKSNAKITDGKTATDPSKDDSQGNDQALLTGTTNADGIVTFNLQNSDTKGEAAPASPTAPTPTEPTKGALFTQIFPEIAGANVDVADFIEIHFYNKAAATVKVALAKKKVIACVRGKSVEKVSGKKPTCPKGYSKK